MDEEEEDEISYQELQNQLLDPIMIPVSSASVSHAPFDDSMIQEYESLANKSRYFTEKAPLKCHFCRKLGHIARECPAKEVACNLCQQDHDPKKCPMSLICFSCYQRGHRKDECPEGRYVRKYCECCETSSHSTFECDQTWRRYVFTNNTPCKRINRYCYQCGETGHFGDECETGLQKRYSAFSDSILRGLQKVSRKRSRQEDSFSDEDDKRSKKVKMSSWNVKKTDSHSSNSGSSFRKGSSSFASRNNESKYKGGYQQFKFSSKPFFKGSFKR